MKHGNTIQWSYRKWRHVFCLHVIHIALFPANPYVHLFLKHHYHICRHHHHPRQRVAGTHRPLCKILALHIFKLCPLTLKLCSLVFEFHLGKRFWPSTISVPHNFMNLYQLSPQHLTFRRNQYKFIQFHFTADTLILVASWMNLQVPHPSCTGGDQNCMKYSKYILANVI